MTKDNETQIDAKSIYHELLETFTEESERSIVMSHFGEFSQDLVNSLTEGLEFIMTEREVDKVLVKRMFSIMIEGLQNIRIHGKSNEEELQLGHVMIKEKAKVFSASFGNIVDENGKKTLDQHLNKLNSFTPEELKLYYLDILGNGAMTDRGGAGLGFTTIALKAKAKIKFQFIDFAEDKYYFEMQIQLD